VRDHALFLQRVDHVEAQRQLELAHSCAASSDQRPESERTIRRMPSS